MTTNSSHQNALALFAEHRGVLWTEEIGVLAEQLMALASALPAPQVPRPEDAYDLRPSHRLSRTRASTRETGVADLCR